ncbi:AraC family transcriptional regulator [Streptomyces lavendulocolor]|uniref:AraC family transcriptional regulator n=1 Tax=Streptomyces lavendulocolor TaxID=67316 RepID=UPI003C306317
MEPLVRSAALTGYTDLCRTLGADASALLRQAGLDAQVLLDQDRWIPARAAAWVLELSAAASGHEDFGLRLADSRRLSNLGPISLLLREEADVRSMLQLLIRYERMYNEALSAELIEADDTATLSITLGVPGARSNRQAVELAVGAYYQVLIEFLGKRLRPRQVCFRHSPPANLETHHRMLGPDIEFNAGFHGIVLAEGALDAANVGADPILRNYAKQYVDSLASLADPSSPEKVGRIIEVLLPTGRCSADQVARSMGVDRRTIHRRLATSGHTFSTLLNQTRLDLARQFMAHSQRPLAEVAQLLGFTSPGAFSRWFRNQLGVSPSQWRRGHNIGAGWSET